MINIFIGYDPKEAVAYHTCANSIIRHASCPVTITPLALNLLSTYNETHTDGSNEFTYTRFLVPELMNYKGMAIYIDCDTIIKTDILELIKLFNNQFAVQVVKHNYKTIDNIKYCKKQNLNYPCKNWSSVIIWNCEHEKNLSLTSESIQNFTGEFLHRFKWLNHEEIGELPKEWNWLSQEYGKNDNANLIHYTLGTPCFDEYAHTIMAKDWHLEYSKANYAIQI